MIELQWEAPRVTDREAKIDPRNVVDGVRGAPRHR